MTTKSPNRSAFENAIEDISILAAASNSEAVLNACIKRLSKCRDDQYWTGVYVLVGEELLVGPYVGPVTDHTRIPIGRGVCGTAVAQNKNQVVDDVSALDNYLACNLLTKSEIVVLIYDADDKTILGQIDIDSTKKASFSTQDESALVKIGELLAPHMRHLQKILAMR